MRILITGGNGSLGKNLQEYVRTHFNEFNEVHPNSNWYFVGRGKYVSGKIGLHQGYEYDLTDKECAKALVVDYNPDVVLHLAAACGGIGLNKRIPADLGRDNLLMGINILEAARMYNVPKVYLVGTVCFTEDCLVRCADYSYKKINQIEVDDLVFSKNGITKVSNLMNKNYSGELFKIRPIFGEEISVTPEHPFLVFRNSKIQWVEASSLVKSDCLIIPKENVVKNEKKFYAHFEKLNNRLIERNLKIKIDPLPEKIEITKDFLFFLGWYLAEGYTAKNGEIFLYFGDELDVINKLIVIIKNLFNRDCRLKKLKNQIGYVLSFNSQQLGFWIKNNFYEKNCPQYTCHYKKIPSFIYELDNDSLKIFINAYFSGDGHISKRKYKEQYSIATVQVVSASRNLIYQMRDLLLKFEVYGSIIKREPSMNNFIQGRKINGKQSWTLKYSGASCTNLIQQIFSERLNEIYQGTQKKTKSLLKSFDEFQLVPLFSIKSEIVENIHVYNLSCEDETYNANGMIVHNCSYPYDTNIPFKEDDLYNGLSEPTNRCYSDAKKMVFGLHDAYRQQCGLKGAKLILANLMGKFDNFDLESSHVIPALIRKFVEAKKENKPFVECWGTGTAEREFLNFEDASRALYLAIKNSLDSELPINVGTGKSILIKDLAVLIGELVGYTGEIVFNGAVSDGQMRRRLDVSRAKEMFGFEAQISLRDGLRNTIEWYESGI